MTQVVLATGNPGKIREFSAALDRVGLSVLGMEALADTTPVEEDGDTFEANARLKAEQYSLRTGLTVLAEDSGLEVDALDGAPGVYSARYGGEGLDDHGRVLKLLEELAGTPDNERTARYRAVLAVARAGKTLATFAGTVDGAILRDCRGEDGFGYDPVFYHESLGSTFAQVSRETKQRLSHRGEVIRVFLKALKAGKLEI
jgi:XTP/dITP diphosphohydrolase